MKIEMKSRSLLIDLLKGVAIIAVILYHSGIFQYGYLGVEIFLVVGGYLISKSILRSSENEKFSYWTYFCRRLVRLWPLLILISLVSLAIGSITMLPEHLKNLSETVVGTSSFSNNFVQYITSGNYWDQGNDFKPLMHTWYIGLMFQFYVLYPLVFMLIWKISKYRFRENLTIVLWIIFFLSLAYYLIPTIPDANKFYLLPARLFEFSLGGLIAVSSQGYQYFEKSKLGIGLLFFLLVSLLVVNANLQATQVRLLVTVFLTATLILLDSKSSFSTASHQGSFATYLHPLVFLGMASYSLYLWHQVVLAFYRYVVNADFTVSSYVIVLSASLLIGILSYYFVEQPISKKSRKKPLSLYIIIGISFVLAVILSVLSLKIYKVHGLIRDVPELNMYVGKSVQETQDYNDAVRQYDHDFESNGKQNVLVIGDSFARDWLNVLVESGAVRNMNLSYHTDADSVLESRIEKADFIFVANALNFDVYYELLPKLMKKKFWRVGHKRFGTCMGTFYNAPRDSNYYHQTVRYNRERDDREQKIFGDRYIDIMAYLRNNEGTYPVFTPNRKFISHDGIHLTPDGCKYLSQLIDIQKYLQ